MHSRVPRTFGPPQIRGPLFRVTEDGALALRIPVTATLTGQLSTFSGGGGVRLALGDGESDEYLEPSDSGGIRIKIT